MASIKMHLIYIIFLIILDIYIAGASTCILQGCRDGAPINKPMSGPLKIMGPPPNMIWGVYVYCYACSVDQRLVFSCSDLFFRFEVFLLFLLEICFLHFFFCQIYCIHFFSFLIIRVFCSCSSVIRICCCNLFFREFYLPLSMPRFMFLFLFQGIGFCFVFLVLFIQCYICLSIGPVMARAKTYVDRNHLR